MLCVCGGVARWTLICAEDLFGCIKLVVNIPFLQGEIDCVLRHMFVLQV